MEAECGGVRAMEVRVSSGSDSPILPTGDLLHIPGDLGPSEERKVRRIWEGRR